MIACRPRIGVWKAYGFRVSRLFETGPVVGMVPRYLLAGSVIGVVRLLGPAQLSLDPWMNCWSCGGADVEVPSVWGESGLSRS